MMKLFCDKCNKELLQSKQFTSALTTVRRPIDNNILMEIELRPTFVAEGTHVCKACALDAVADLVIASEAWPG